MRAKILPMASILTKAHRVVVSIIAKRCILGRELPLRCLLFLLSNYINVCTIKCKSFHILTRGKYCNIGTPPPGLPANTWVYIHEPQSHGWTYIKRIVSLFKSMVIVPGTKYALFSLFDNEWQGLI